ncbi:MarR family transcriptional regulator [Lachnoclostridium pacaense]|uniref:MarR family winged helix-turn-helix transcriptional regulator n=2 Tax=Enterocloster hominis (ex Hitch et al. 2024) TaxID=1917870 RepID=UPI001D114658|nr:MarR family winged helix-turn-helix transcriptional regulator [Lachnoclostridium pacaense]MCC2879910.1 MarR family transcriptional regulator [Lachnoclostridium pacaense]
MEHLGNGEADVEGGQEKMHQEDGMQEGQGAFAGHRRPMPHGHGRSGRHGEHGMSEEQGKHGMSGEQGRHGMSEEQGRHGVCGEQGRHGMRGEQGRHGMREEQGEHEIHGERRKGHGRFGRRLEGMEGEDGLSALLGKCGHYLYHRPYHGRGQGRILKMLSGQEEVTQKELQETLGIQAGSVSEIISKLEARGLVARERDDADKRRVLLRITEEGKKRAETDFDEGKTEDLYGVLSEEEQETLKGLLGRLLESWGMTGQDPQ